MPRIAAGLPRRATCQPIRGVAEHAVEGMWRAASEEHEKGIARQRKRKHDFWMSRRRDYPTNREFGLRDLRQLPEQNRYGDARSGRTKSERGKADTAREEGGIPIDEIGGIGSA